MWYETPIHINLLEDPDLRVKSFPGKANLIGTCSEADPLDPLVPGAPRV